MYANVIIKVMHVDTKFGKQAKSLVILLLGNILIFFS